MALPPGITPKTVTVGIGSFFDGTLAGGRVIVSAPVNVIHSPSGRPIFSSDISKPFVDGSTYFDLCPTDAPGLNRVDWVYKLRVFVDGATTQPEPIYFLLSASGPDSIDLDSLVSVPSSAGTPVSVNALTVPAGGGPGQALLYTDGSGVAWGAVQSAGDYATNTALSSGLGGKVNSSTYTTGLAGKADLSGGVVPDAQLPTRLGDTALRAALVPRPTGGTDGQALVKSGTDVVWATVSGGGASVTDNGDGTASTGSSSVTDNGDGTAQAA